MISITVEASAGSEILYTSREAVELANRIQVCTEFKFNDVLCIVFPGDNPEALAEDYHRQLASKSQYKFARDRTREVR